MPRHKRSFTCLILTFFISVPLLAQQQPGSQFQRLDKNNDGKLSSDEVQQKQLFKRLDTDGDGFVTPEEAKHFQGTRTARTSTKSSTATEEIAYGEHKDIIRGTHNG